MLSGEKVLLDRGLVLWSAHSAALGEHGGSSSRQHQFLNDLDGAYLPLF